MAADDPILGTGRFDAVRMALGVDESIVSDSIVSGLPFGEYVELNLKALVPTWEAILAAGGIDAARLRNAAVFGIAARIAALYMPRFDAERYRIDDYTQNSADLDWPAQAATLASEAAKFLNQVSTFTTPDRQTLFKRSGPTRSESNRPASFTEILDEIQPVFIDWLEQLEEATL